MPDTTTKALFRSIFNNQTALVERSLGLLAPQQVNSPSPDGQFLIHAAVRVGNPDIVELLIQAGADVLARDGDGRLPVDHCLLRGTYKDFLCACLIVGTGENGVVGKSARQRQSSPNRATRLGGPPPHEESTHGSAKSTRGHLGAENQRQPKPHTRSLNDDQLQLRITQLWHRILCEFPDIVTMKRKHGEYVNNGVAMHHLAGAGNIDVAVVMAQVAPDCVDAQDDLGKTPLHVAAHYGRVDMVNLFVRVGANVMHLDQQGQTPLQTAKSSRVNADNNKRVLVSILSNAMDANLPLATVAVGRPEPRPTSGDLFGACPRPPCEQACNRELAKSATATFHLNPTTVEAKPREDAEKESQPPRTNTQGGTDTQCTPNTQDTAIQAVRQNLQDALNTQDIVQLEQVLECMSPPELINAPDEFGATVLHCATARLDLGAIQALLHFGADIHARDNNGTTPLGNLLARCDAHHIAILRQIVGWIHSKRHGEDAATLQEDDELFHIDMLRRFPDHLANRHDLGERYKCNGRPVGVLVAYGVGRIDQSNLFHRALRAGFDPTETNTDGQTLLHLAAEQGDVETVRWLLQQDVIDRHARDFGERTALEMSITSFVDGSLACARALLGQAAPLDDKQGFAFRVATLKQHPDMLRRRGTMGTPPLTDAVWRNNWNVVRLLLAAGANINGTNEAGQTALCLAVESSKVKMVCFLIHHGADPWQRDRYGHSCFSTCPNPSDKFGLTRKCVVLTMVAHLALNPVCHWNRQRRKRLRLKGRTPVLLGQNLFPVARAVESNVNPKREKAVQK